MKPNRFKVFKVASVSSNMNSFGLTGMVLMAADGEAYEVGANSLVVKTKGSIVRVPTVGRSGRNFNFAHLGFEIPRKLPTAPPAVVAEVFD